MSDLIGADNLGAIFKAIHKITKKTGIVSVGYHIRTGRFQLGHFSEEEFHEPVATIQGPPKPLIHKMREDPTSRVEQVPILAFNLKRIPVTDIRVEKTALKGAMYCNRVAKQYNGECPYVTYPTIGGVAV